MRRAPYYTPTALVPRWPGPRSLPPAAMRTMRAADGRAGGTEDDEPGSRGRVVHQPKTVGTSLARTYRRLVISSRAKLGRPIGYQWARPELRLLRCYG
jgi:hypothetical protein